MFIKKRLLLIILTIVPTTILALWLYLTHSSPVYELLPQVRQILQKPPQPDEIKLKQNVFVGLVGLDAQENMDYMAIGSQVTLENYAMLVQNLDNPNSEKDRLSAKQIDLYNKKTLKFKQPKDLENKWFTCTQNSSQTDQCIDNILTKKTAISALIHDNRLLLERYQAIKQLPDDTVHPYNMNYIAPDFHTVTQLSHLRLAQAVLAFDAGAHNTGFAILQEEAVFARKMLLSSNSLVYNMTGVSLLEAQLNVINSLWNLPKIRPFLKDKRWQYLYTPLTQTEQTTLASAFKTERNAIIRSLYNLSDISQKHDMDMALNSEYLLWQPTIDRASLNIEQASRRYEQELLTPVVQEEEGIASEQRSKIRLNWRYNKAFTNIFLVGRPNWEKQIQKLYNLQSYIALTQVKHELLSNKVSADAVAASLETMGDKAKNPLTRQPFVWDVGRQTLSTTKQRLNSKDAKVEKTVDNISVYIAL